MTKKNHLQDLIAKAVEVEDQTETQTTGDFSYDPPAAGRTTARFIEYIELGTQKQKPYMGKPKQSKEKVRITFELLGKKNIKEIEVNGEKRQIADKISVTVPKSLHEKANFKKLFEKMRYGRDDIKHMAQMLSEGFLVTITHNVVKKDKTEVTYANLTDADGSYQVGAPVNITMDDEGNEVTKKLKVAEPMSDLKLFLWDNPTKETWDSLFIDGEREVKDDKGGKKIVSKNWLQETILNAEDFEGSALELMLEGADDLPEDPEDLEDDEEELDEDEIEDEEELEDEEDDSEDEIEDEEELEDEDELEEDDEEEEDEEPAPPKKKKTVVKTAAKSSKKATSKKSDSATTATKSPYKKKAPAKKKAAKEDDPLAALGLDV